MIFILLPVHNRCEFTSVYLQSLTTQDLRTSISVYVIDDNSTDDTPALLDEWARGLHGDFTVTVIRSNQDLWWAGAVQRGLRTVLPLLQEDDFVYLANNDSIPDPNHFEALLTKTDAQPSALIGTLAFEVWETGHHHPVSAGFLIDTRNLEVVNIPGDAEPSRVDGLSARGLLIPAIAARRIRMHPRLMPQHFADISMTSALRRSGVPLAVDHSATAKQLARAGSSVEFKPSIRGFFTKRSSLYLPALATFWWLESTWPQRLTLPWRFLFRGISQMRSRAYTWES